MTDRPQILSRCLRAIVWTILLVLFAVCCLIVFFIGSVWLVGSLALALIAVPFGLVCALIVKLADGGET